MYTIHFMLDTESKKINVINFITSFIVKCNHVEIIKVVNSINEQKSGFILMNTLF